MNGPDSPILDRRAMLRTAGAGFGSLALAALMADEQRARADVPNDPLAPRQTHYEPSAKRVLFLFMSGGPSHVDTFDPKPTLTKLHGEKLPASFGPVKTRRGVDKNRLLASKRTFKKHGQSGIEVSDWFPHTAKHVDDLCVIRGCYGDSVTHPESVYLMNTGSILMGRPSLGAWASYGLGTENRNFPAFVVLPDPGGWPKGGAPAWGNGYLPATYQGTLLTGGTTPIQDLATPTGVDAGQQRRTLDLIGEMNREHKALRGNDSELNARINAYELAFRMQSHAPELIDLTKETADTKRLYGFVHLYSGDTNGWDAHSDLEGNHGKLAKASDKPIAGLLADLKARGLLKDTLVIWGGEFGRTPMTEGTNGRDHNPHGFTMWLAGGGAKGGQVIGATDEIGLRATTDRAHVHDLHATILYLLGIDHLKLTFRHNGRNERLTDNAGEVIERAVAS
jgi:hypothetical protein